jgi:molecular chaperone DnaK
VTYGLGVDLGASFTSAAISQGGRTRMVALGDPDILLPSVVRVAPDGSLVTGPTGPLDDEGPSLTARNFKRGLGAPDPLILGGTPYSAVTLLAVTLHSVMQNVVRLEGGPPDRVTLTSPALWSPYLHELFAGVPRLAGLDADRVTVIREPEAAVAHYAARHYLSEGDAVAVYDLGGGTFRTAVARVRKGRNGGYGAQIIGQPEGFDWLGGEAFDQALLSYLDQALGGAVSALDPNDPATATTLWRIQRACTRAKEKLSRLATTEIIVPLPDRRVEVPLSRADFEDMIRLPLDSTMAALARTIESAELTAAGLSGVLLIGGSSRIPLVAELLSENLGRPVLLDPEPQHCVALGAATFAESQIPKPASGPALTRGGPSATRGRSFLTRGRLSSMGKRPPVARDRRRVAAGATLAVLIGGTAIGVGTGAFGSGTTNLDVHFGAAPANPVSSGSRASTPAGATAGRTPLATSEASRTSTSVKSPRPKPTGSIATGPAAHPGNRPVRRPRTTSPAVKPTGGGPLTTPTASPSQAPIAGPTTSTLSKPSLSKPISALIGFTGPIAGVEDTCLDAANAEASDDAAQIADCNGTKAQTWTGTAAGTVKTLGGCLTSDAADGSPASLQTCDGSAAQRWTMTGTKIVNVGSSKCLDADPAEGPQVLTATCDGGAGQRWTLGG